MDPRELALRVSGSSSVVTPRRIRPGFLDDGAPTWDEPRPGVIATIGNKLEQWAFTRPNNAIGRTNLTQWALQSKLTDASINRGLGYFDGLASVFGFGSNITTSERWRAKDEAWNGQEAWNRRVAETGLADYIPEFTAEMAARTDNDFQFSYLLNYHAELAENNQQLDAAARQHGLIRGFGTGVGTFAAEVVTDPLFVPLTVATMGTGTLIRAAGTGLIKAGSSLAGGSAALRGAGVRVVSGGNALVATGANGLTYTVASAAGASRLATTAMLSATAGVSSAGLDYMSQKESQQFMSELFDDPTFMEQPLDTMATVYSGIFGLALGGLFGSVAARNIGRPTGGGASAAQITAKIMALDPSHPVAVHGPRSPRALHAARAETIAFQSVAESFDRVFGGAGGRQLLNSTLMDPEILRLNGIDITHIGHLVNREASLDEIRDWLKRSIAKGSPDDAPFQANWLSRTERLRREYESQLARMPEGAIDAQDAARLDLLANKTSREYDETSNRVAELIERKTLLESDIRLLANGTSARIAKEIFESLGGPDAGVRNAADARKILERRLNRLSRDLIKAENKFNKVVNRRRALRDELFNPKNGRLKAIWNDAMSATRNARGERLRRNAQIKTYEERVARLGARRQLLDRWKSSLEDMQSRKTDVDNPEVRFVQDPRPENYPEGGRVARALFTDDEFLEWASLQLGTGIEELKRKSNVLRMNNGRLAKTIERDIARIDALTKRSEEATARARDSHAAAKEIQEGVNSLAQSIAGKTARYEKILGRIAAAQDNLARHLIDSFNEGASISGPLEFDRALWGRVGTASNATNPTPRQVAMWRSLTPDQDGGIARIGFIPRVTERVPFLRSVKNGVMKLATWGQSEILWKSKVGRVVETTSIIDGRFTPEGYTRVNTGRRATATLSDALREVHSRQSDLFVQIDDVLQRNREAAIGLSDEDLGWHIQATIEGVETMGNLTKAQKDLVYELAGLLDEAYSRIAREKNASGYGTRVSRVGNWHPRDYVVPAVRDNPAEFQATVRRILSERAFADDAPVDRALLPDPDLFPEGMTLREFRELNEEAYLAYVDRVDLQIRERAETYHRHIVGDKFQEEGGRSFRMTALNRERARTIESEVYYHPSMRPYISTDVMGAFARYSEDTLYRVLRQEILNSRTGIRGLGWEQYVELQRAAAQQEAAAGRLANAAEIDAAFDLILDTERFLSRGGRQESLADSGMWRVADFLSALTQTVSGPTWGLAVIPDIIIRMFGSQQNMASRFSAMGRSLRGLTAKEAAREMRGVGRSIDSLRTTDPRHVYTGENPHSFATGARNRLKGSMRRLKNSVTEDLGSDVGQRNRAVNVATTYTRETGGAIVRSSGMHALHDWNSVRAYDAVAFEFGDTWDAFIQLRQRLAEVGDGVDDKTFKRLAREAGFGGKHQLARRLYLDSGLHLEENWQVIRYLHENNISIFKDRGRAGRSLDLDVLSDLMVREDLPQELIPQIRQFSMNMRGIFERRMNNLAIKPGIFDMMITSQRSPMSAVFNQLTSFVRASRHNIFAESLEAGGLQATKLMMGVFIGEAIYTSLREIARGEKTSEQVAAEWEKDPTKKIVGIVSRAPWLGMANFIPESIGAGITGEPMRGRIMNPAPVSYANQLWSAIRDPISEDGAAWASRLNPVTGNIYGQTILNYMKQDR